MFDTRFFCDNKGKSQVLEALDKLPEQVQAKAYARIERLSQEGHNLRRPESDFLRDGIYELRWRNGKVQYRILYFFAGERIVVLSHIITKEKDIPKSEIERGIENKRLFEGDPERYTYREHMGNR